MRFLALLLTTLTLAATALTACGKDTVSASSAAASLVPANAAVYAEATLKPDADQQQALNELVAKFPGGGGDVGAKLQQLISDALRSSDSGISYEDNIKPWLGDDAAVFVSGFGLDGKPRDVGVLLATDDEGQALAAVKKSEPKAKQASYKGKDYVTFVADGDQLAAGTVDGWLLVGTVTGFKAAADAASGEGLAGTDRYKQALAGAAEDRLGLVYLDVGAFADLVGKLGAAAPLGAFKGAFDKPYVMTFSADADGAEIATQVSTKGNSLLGPLLGQGSKLLGDVPADSWLAIGQPELGKLLDRSISQFTAQVGGRAVVEQQLKGATGLSFDDLFGWMGDFSLFVRGESVSGLGGALVVETTDQAASAKVIQTIRRLAGSSANGTQVRPLGLPGAGFQLSSPGVPQPLFVYQRAGRVVIAYGESAARDALDAPQPLADSSAFKAAVDSLGDGYNASTWLAVAPILKLVQSTPLAGDATWDRIKRYLEPLGGLVAGSKKDGDRLSSVLRITVP
jgi:hypothetical protein